MQQWLQFVAAMMLMCFGTPGLPCLCTQVEDNLAPLYSNRSASYLKLDRKEEALADAEKAVEADPKWPKGFYRKALTLQVSPARRCYRVVPGTCILGDQEADLPLLTLFGKSTRIRKYIHPMNPMNMRSAYSRAGNGKVQASSPGLRTSPEI